MAMGYELLKALVELLRSAGISAGEAYPGAGAPAVDGPQAAVGLLELDVPAGLAKFHVRVLSPRMLGGWNCQIWAARVSDILNAAGMTCEAREMEYLDGLDCFGITIRADQQVSRKSDGSFAGVRLQIFCGEAEQTGVESFTAVRNQGRRILGAFCQSEAVGITSGGGGWNLELLQRLDRLPEGAAEPFTLTVREGDRESRYTGCGWNEERFEHTRSGLRLIRRGFALAREEVSHG